MQVDQDGRLERALGRAARGDETAFAELVQAHQAMVFSIGWHYLQDRSLAEDLAQEVFWELYQGVSAIKSAAHLVYWLRRVTVHRCIDQGRKKTRRRELALEDAPEPVSRGENADPILLKKLRQSLSTLPEKQRMVVVLRYQEGLGPAEIAELMHMPVNTVKSMLHRCLEDLRAKMTRAIGEIRYALF